MSVSAVRLCADYLTDRDRDALDGSCDLRRYVYRHGSDVKGGLARVAVVAYHVFCPLREDCVTKSPQGVKACGLEVLERAVGRYVFCPILGVVEGWRMPSTFARSASSLRLARTLARLLVLLRCLEVMRCFIKRPFRCLVLSARSALCVLRP